MHVSRRYGYAVYVRLGSLPLNHPSHFACATCVFETWLHAHAGFLGIVLSFYARADCYAERSLRSACKLVIRQLLSTSNGTITHFGLIHVLTYVYVP